MYGKIINMKLIEWESISDEVVDLAEFVGNAIIKDAAKQPKQKSTQTMAIFVENKFQIKINSFLKNGNILTVEYIMYFVQTEELYNYLIGRIGSAANSEADEETNSIKIVSGFVNNEVMDDFIPTITHELEHLFQYGNGMKKRKTLYDKTQELINLGRSNIDAYYVGLCSYYSFKHEQDAFAHQFYSELMEKLPNDNFDSLLEKSPYKYMNNAYKVLVKIKNKPTVINAIHSLDYSVRDFLKLVRYRRKRFFTKMRNVCFRYFEETETVNEYNIDRIIKREFDRLDECKKYNSEIKWGRESIFDF